MTNNIVQIDLDKLDAEIASLHLQIELLMNTKRYAQSIGIKSITAPVSKKVTVKKTTGKKVFAKKAAPAAKARAKEAAPKAVVAKKAAPKAKKATKTAKQPKAKDALSVTDFILAFLKGNERADSQAIIKAYATYTGKTEKRITSNVSNALSRLKTSKKANNAPKADGKKKGTDWFLTEGK
jgi:hypothetical protein